MTSGEEIVVGVNAYVDDEAAQPERFDVPVGLAEEQRAALDAVRSGATSRPPMARFGRSQTQRRRTAT